MLRAGYTSARGRWSEVAGKVLLLGGLVLSGSGCQRHYYYYYGGSPTNCPPVGTTIQEGPVCEVPGSVIQGGTVVSSATEDLPVITKSRRSKVVVSEANRGGKSSWKASDAETSVARTQVDGAIGDSVRQ